MKFLKTVWAFILSVLIGGRKVAPQAEPTPEETEALRKKIIARFGVKGNRTREQWANLVLDIGYESVCSIENLTPAQLRKKINPSMSEQFAEKARQQNLERLNKK